MTSERSLRNAMSILALTKKKKQQHIRNERIKYGSMCVAYLLMYKQNEKLNIYNVRGYGPLHEIPFGYYYDVFAEHSLDQSLSCRIKLAFTPSVTDEKCISSLRQIPGMCLQKSLNV